MKNPKFSLIIPTYNRANLIPKNLQSILEQSHQDFEVIIVDDGSTDNTQAVVCNFLNEKIHYFKIPNGERAKARNFGIQQAKGEFVSFLDSDDLLLPNYFEEATHFILQNPQSVFFSLAYQVTDPQGNIIYKQNKRKGNLAKQLATGNHLSCIGVFVKREIIQKHLFNEQRELSGTEDYELWLRLASLYPLDFKNTVVASIVNHEERSVLNINEDKLIKRMEVLFACIENNIDCMNFYGAKGIQTIKAHSWLYVALHLAMAKKKKTALKYLLKAVQEDFRSLFTKKFLVILRKIFLR
ncbi:MAG: hypothetical protein OHK0045_04890 [Raineya sp.]